MFIFMVVDTERKIKRIKRWGEMTQSINCPLCKYKDPSVVPSTHIKADVVLISGQGRGIESGGSLELTA